MLIILEGPDGVGKTTLAQKLHDVIRDQDHAATIAIIRKGPPTAHPLEEYLAPLLSYRPGNRIHMILDRWHLGEYVYPRLTERETQLDEPSWWYINQYVRRLGGLLVWCFADAERVGKVYAERRSTHPLESADLYDQVEKLFSEAADSACLPQVIYNWNDPGYSTPESIVRTAQARELMMKPLNDVVTYVGRAFPRYLLLGDVRHDVDAAQQRETRSDPRPAFVPYPATSGHWLLTALQCEPLLLDYAGIANACDVDDVFALWRKLGKPRVVTLGKNAHRELTRIGDIPHGCAPHPQFGRRFYHRHHQSYAAALLSALVNEEDHSKWRGSSQEPTGRPSTPRSSTTSAGAAPDATPATA